jgi:hypothetical protein
LLQVQDFADAQIQNPQNVGLAAVCALMPHASISRSATFNISNFSKLDFSVVLQTHKYP